MGSLIRHDGETFDLFHMGLRHLLGSLEERAFVDVYAPRVIGINPVHWLVSTPEVLGQMYLRYTKEENITDRFSTNKEPKDPEWRIEALLWLRKFLSSTENLNGLAACGPVTIELPDREGNDIDGGYFLIRNWVSSTCMPNNDWSLGPKYGLRFTS